jgi:hypothetical protein
VRCPPIPIFHPLRTLDCARLRLTVEQPSSGIPSSWQTISIRPVIGITGRYRNGDDLRRGCRPAPRPAPDTQGKVPRDIARRDNRSQARGMLIGEITELPMAKSAKSSDILNKPKLDRHRQRTTVTHKPALAYLVEWEANQKGRRALVLRLSSALVRVCAEKGVPVRLCPQTKTRLFPVDVANEFMLKVGASWVEGHNATSRN